MSFAPVSNLFGMFALLPRRRAVRVVMPASPVAARAARGPIPELPPLPAEASYEPFRDYRPGARSGDPYRPW